MARHGVARTLAALVTAALLAACGSTVVTPTPAPSPVPSAPPSTPTAAPTPTASPTSSPTPTPTPVPTPPPLVLHHCPGRAATALGGAVDFTSTNWSGYIAGNGRTGQVTCVEGAWIEPSVTCPRSGTTDVAVWVGLDGSSSSHLGTATLGPEQVGTEVDCHDGALAHVAWWETVPSVDHSISFGDVIKPASGDHMWAQVSYGTHGFTMTLTDLTSQETDAITQQVKGAPRLTAQWIVEAPSEACGKDICAILALAKFARITFTGGLTVIGGRLGSIGDRHWSRDEVTDVSNSGTRRTTVSGLTSRGQSFTVTWRHV